MRIGREDERRILLEDEAKSRVAADAVDGSPRRRWLHQRNRKETDMHATIEHDALRRARPPHPRTRPVVAARDLVRRYGEGETAVDALRGVSLDVAAGGLTAVVGPSGSGKSTLMHILAGLDQPDGGNVEIAGEDITRMGDNELTRLRRRHIGFVFQFFNLLPMLSAEENVVLPLSIAGEKPDRAWLEQLLSDVGLQDRRRHRPSELSGGQQQRVAVARSLVTRPTVLFADEPTGNLDSTTGMEINPQHRQDDQARHGGRGREGCTAPGVCTCRVGGDHHRDAQRDRGVQRCDPGQRQGRIGQQQDRQRELATPGQRKGEDECRDGPRGRSAERDQHGDLVGIGSRRQPDLGLDEHGQGDRQKRRRPCPGAFARLPSPEASAPRRVRPSPT